MQEKNKIKIDLTLTPENSRELGYEWFSDIFYDPNSPKEVNEAILEDKSDFILGQPASRSLEAISEFFYGYYKKINL